MSGFVGSALTKHLTFQNASTQEFLTQTNRKLVTSEDFVADLFNLQRGELADVIDTNFSDCRTVHSSNLVVFQVLGANESVLDIFPCPVIQVPSTIQLNQTKVPVVLFFKPSTQAPIHLLTYEHLSEELALKSSAKRLIRSFFRLKTPGKSCDLSLSISEA